MSRNSAGAAGDSALSHQENVMFARNDVVVQSGDMVEFENRDFVPRRATASDKSFDTLQINNDHTGVFIAGALGRFDFGCRIHPFLGLHDPSTA